MRLIAMFITATCVLFLVKFNSMAKEKEYLPLFAVGNKLQYTLTLLPDRLWKKLEAARDLGTGLFFAVITVFISVFIFAQDLVVIPRKSPYLVSRVAE